MKTFDLTTLALLAGSVALALGGVLADYCGEVGLYCCEGKVV